MIAILPETFDKIKIIFRLSARALQHLYLQASRLGGSHHPGRAPFPQGPSSLIHEQLLSDGFWKFGTDPISLGSLKALRLP